MEDEWQSDNKTPKCFLKLPEGPLANTLDITPEQAKELGLKEGDVISLTVVYCSETEKE